MTNDLKLRPTLSKILSSLAAGQHGEADALLAQLVECHGTSTTTKLIGAWSVYAKDRSGKNSEDLTKAIQGLSVPAGLFVEIAGSMLKANEFAAAGQMIEQSVKLDLGQNISLTLKARLALATDDHAAELAALEALCDLPDLNPRYGLIRLAERRQEVGDLSGAVTLLERLAVSNPKDPGGWDRLAAVAQEIGDAETSIRSFKELVNIQPTNKRFLRDLIKSYQFVGREAEAIEVAQHVFDTVAQPDLGLCQAVLRLRLPARLEQQVADCANRAVLSNFPVERAEALNILYQLERPIPEAVSLDDLKDEDLPERIRQMFRLLKKSPPDGALKRPLVKREGLEEVSIAHATKPSVLVIVFTGLADKMGFPIHIFDRYLAALDVSAIYLRDSSRMLFGNGLETFGGDYDGTLLRLKETIAQSGARRVVTIGSSAGGFAAIRYGLDLQSDAILGFSAPTDLTRDFHKDDGRAPMVLNRLQSLPVETLKIRPILDTRDNTKTAIHLVYGAQMKQDVRHAENIRDYGCVSLHPIAGLDTHASARGLLEQGQLEPLLRMVLEV